MQLRNVSLIAKRDLKVYFSSPIGYFLMAVFAFIMGYMFFSILSIYMGQAMQFEQMRFGKGPNLTDQLIRPIWGNMNVVLLLMAPFITMRLFAEERKNNTIELLLTSPVRMSEIIFGKFLSALFFLTLMLALTLPFPIAMGFATKPDWAVIALCYLGTFCMVAVYIAIGLWCSSFTENQIIAAVMGFGIILFFWIIKWATYNSTSALGDVFGYLSIVDHFEDFSRGVFSTKDLVFFGSAVFFWLFLTYKTLESYTWRS